MATRFLKSLLGALGIIVARRSHSSAKYLLHPPQSSLDDVLLRIFPSLNNLSFVQIGANDGSRADPINKYIKACGWKGVLVEPNPFHFEKLRKTYHGCKGLRFLECALDNVARERPLYFLRSGIAGLPDWTEGTGSLDPERLRHVATELSLPPDAVVSRIVKTIEWGGVWTALGSESCDVMVLDTEGHDIVLLRGADLARRRPRVIHFEHACVSKSERMAFYGTLLDLGYELVTSQGDTTAYLSSNCT